MRDGNTVLAQPLDERVDITVLAGVLDASCQVVNEGNPPRERWKTPVCWLYDLHGLLGWLRLRLGHKDMECLMCTL